MPTIIRRHATALFMLLLSEARGDGARRRRRALLARAAVAARACRGVPFCRPEDARREAARSARCGEVAVWCALTSCRPYTSASRR